MNTKIITFTILLLIGIIPISIAQNNNDWQQQLESLKEKAVNENIPQLIKINKKKEIKTKEEVESLKQLLLSEKDSYFPIDKKDGSYSLKNLKEIRKEQGDKDVQSAIKNLTTYLEQSINIGMSTVELTWKLDGKTYKSTCVVSDTQGIIYDSIITNIMTFKDQTKK